MRILQLTQYLAVGGLERCVTQLAAGLAINGEQSYVAAYEAEGVSASFRQFLREHGVKFFVWQKRRGFSIFTLIRLARIAHREKIEIIHSHDLGALIYAILVSFVLLRKVKVVHTQHSFVHFRKNKSRYVLYERIFPRCAQLVCAVSQRVAEYYRTLGIQSEKLVVLSNGIVFPSQYVDAKSAKEKLEHIYPLQLDSLSKILQNNRKVLLYLGRVVRGKGIERLLRAWFGLPERVKINWSLLLVGPQNDSGFLQEQVALCSRISEPPVFWGSTDHPQLFYQVSDAFVSLSEEEGMPLAAHEALGCGLPALLSDIPGHRELSEVCRLVSEKASVTDSEHLEKFLLDAEASGEKQFNWSKMSFFRRKHSFSAMVEQYVGRYKDVIVVLALFVGVVFFSPPAQADSDKPQLTSLLERPEYLHPADWEDQLNLSLAPGEKTLLTLRAHGYCGNLPALSRSLSSAGVSIRWYGGISIPVKKPSFEGAVPGAYVDALIPLQDRAPCRNSAAHQFDWLFAELAIAHTASAGSVSGFLESKMSHWDSESEDLVQRWSIELRRLPIKIPEVWSLPLRAEFTPFFAALAHYGRSGREEADLTRKYIHSMYEHRLLPLKAWIKHPFMSERERLAENFLLSRYPQKEMSFPSTVLSILPKWVRIDIPRIDSNSSEERRSYWKRWQSFLDSESDDPSENEVIRRFRNHPMVYLWDEPLQEQFSALHEYASDVQANAPAVSSLVTVYPWESLQESIHIFAPLLQQLVREGRPTLLEGRELWSYVSCMSHGCGSEYSSGEPDFVIERNAAYIRVWPWIADAYNLTSVLYYSVNNIWRKSRTHNPWSDVYDFTGNGDGTLYYPGKPGEYGLKDHTPIPSLRIKFWQQASFDYEYLRWAREMNPICFLKIKEEMSLVRDGISWVRDPRQYRRARVSLVECVLEKLRNNSSSR